MIRPHYRSCLCDQCAPVVAAPPPAHVVTITPDESDLDSGIVTYVWSCSCGNAFGRCDTDAEARHVARGHDADAEFASRAEMPFTIVKGAS